MIHAMHRARRVSLPRPWCSAVGTGWLLTTISSARKRGISRTFISRFAYPISMALYQRQSRTNRVSRSSTLCDFVHR